MASILIKDTTREQREQIVRESLGDDYDVGCGYESTGINYQLYIDGIKEGLEGLKGKIPGLVDIKVNTSGRLASSTADLMLDSTFESEEALKGYSKHPEHVAVADSKVRPYTASRACLDFEV